MPFNPLFAGRVMNCQKCGWRFKSTMDFQSQWTTVEVEGRLLDFCPYCWGVPHNRIPVQVKDAHTEFLRNKENKHV